MNKQQLANKIWKSANQMRSKIEANEYKDFILGFMFYKYLSEKELAFFHSQGMTEADIQGMDETDTDFVEYTKDKIGYFIAYDNLFSTWIDKKSDFDVSDVRNGLSAFSRLISPTHKKVFEKIFNTLQTGLSKLGDSASTQTKAISGLIKLINEIPMDGKQDYDVLGFIYEYLIQNFAANAGKKAGEFYTPHEVSVLMSEIVADHLKDKEEIRIYDPTSGSGSLLINIGTAVSKYMKSPDKVKYYAQELKENTYNLTRMNLVMRGISPSNLFVRNGDTLEDDWPFFEEGQTDTYQLVKVDAVVSNPPYSQKWDVKDKKFDPRFSNYGVAPKGKADLAFLLHDLYHLEDDGIMTIVLPHGVLFRGNEEETIRINLIEKNNIDAIIGLPENIFYGTQIRTIIMILKRTRSNTDVLYVDASNGFEKGAKKNILRASDIKRIVDVVKARSEVPGYSVLVKKEQIVANNYNLNIPRYLDTFEPAEPWDIHSIMFGGIPNAELDSLNEFWDAMPGMREEIFRSITSAYVELCDVDVEQLIKKHPATQKYKASYADKFEGFQYLLSERLLKKYDSVNSQDEEERISEEMFRRMNNIKVIDPYEAYQILDNAWRIIQVDLEILQTEGESALSAVDPHMVTKKKDDEEIEVQEGWEGRVLPFELVQRIYMRDELTALEEKEAQLSDLSSVYEEVIDSLTEEEQEGDYLKDGNFVSKEVKAKVEELLADIETDEIVVLQQYLSLSKKKEKIEFVATHNEVDWTSMLLGNNGTYAKTAIVGRINELKRNYNFDEDSFENKIVTVLDTIEKESALKKEVRDLNAALHAKTKEMIELISYDDAIAVLSEKWITPIVDGIASLPDKVISELIARLVAINNKYKKTFAEIGEDIQSSEKRLIGYISDIAGNDYTMQGFHELISILGGQNYE